MAHADQTFFITLAAFFYLMSYFKKQKGVLALVPTGLLLGLAFTLHAVTLFYVPVFIALEVFLWLFDKPFVFKEVCARIFGLFVFFLLPAFVVELISVFGRTGSAPLFTFIHKGYLGQIVFLDSGDAIQNGLITNRNLGRWHMVSLSGVYNGWLFAGILVLAGIMFFLRHVLKKRNFIAVVLFILSAGVLIYWQFFTNYERQFRLILSAYPFFCIVMGVFINDLTGKKGIKILIVSLLLIEGLYYSAKVVRESKSYFSAVEKFLIDNKTEKILTTSYYIATTSDVLMPGLIDSNVICVPNVKEAKKETAAAGKAYLIRTPDNWLETEEFHFKATPVFLIPDQFYFYFPSFYENLKFKGRTDDLKLKNEVFARHIAIFDMKDLLLEKR